MKTTNLVLLSPWSLTFFFFFFFFFLHNNGKKEAQFTTDDLCRFVPELI